ncbi:hypothetical protein GKE82_23490 [Conexibacter sp. W3-3-2]|uniref:DUF6915 family protein n=1 Tax=Conexibacter sp. W3-3-2 TaxID=2675227 RepID=UPI0012B6C76C|nr:hypothetical protein [Conexibacter sp. W3-3-2]MTD47169.1 hypothetical protein [Conexibacter sp. W3-3-2]
MAKPLVHARSSARRFLPAAHLPPEQLEQAAAEILPVHQLMDRSKGATGHNGHRALLHHADAGFLLEAIYGHELTLSCGARLSVRALVEQHLQEDFHGCIPTASDYWRTARRQTWWFTNTARETLEAHSDRTHRRYGGPRTVHQRIHRLLEYGAVTLPHGLHRALTHHSFGVWLVEQAVGETLPNGTPTRAVAADHITTDLDRPDVPDAGEWLEHLPLLAWMNGSRRHRPPSNRHLTPTRKEIAR